MKQAAVMHDTTSDYQKILKFVKMYRKIEESEMITLISILHGFI